MTDDLHHSSRERRAKIEHVERELRTRGEIGLADQLRAALSGSEEEGGQSRINPSSPDWLDGYLTAETEYEAGHGSKDDQIARLRGALEEIADRLPMGAFGSPIARAQAIARAALEAVPLPPSPIPGGTERCPVCGDESQPADFDPCHKCWPTEAKSEEWIVDPQE